MVKFAISISNVLDLMRLRSTFLLLLCTLFATGLSAQTILFAENFDNGCVYPAGWQTKTTGNPNPVWYVDSGLQNDDENGLSMNGSCFLVIDDDDTGDNTPAYVIDFITPAFDASQFPTVSLSVDVHYRDYGPANESFQVLVTDGVTETVLRTFAQGSSTGDSIFEYRTLKFDLSFITASPNTRIIFRYDDGGGFGWWAAVDNIVVTGSGIGQNVVKESFNACEKPADWETEIVTGVDDWVFGLETNPNTISNGTSMDGSCMVFFDDDLLGAAAPFSTVRLKSPWFDGTKFGRFELNFDIIMRYYSEKISVYVEHGDGSEYLVESAAYDVGGPHFPNYVNSTLDISPYRDKQMRVVFEYDDGQDFAWWIGLDNIKVTGSGVANDVCANAMPLTTGANCLASNNSTALFDGPVPACIQKPVASLWYSWTADFTGSAKLSTGSTFNDVVNVFTGDCGAPLAMLCNNRDEHGFTGESTYFPVQSGTAYFIRVCGREDGFGVSRGDLCIKIEQVPVLPAVPANDNCAAALPLVLDAPCTTGSNINAGSSTATPSRNELARADIWYKFTAPVLAPGEVLELKSNANFSDIMTVFSGSCGDLNEVIGDHKGGKLDLNTLTPGTAYFLQIAGNFATIEGAVCPLMVKKVENAPNNNNCIDATALSIGSNCTQSSNVGASFSGHIPPCVPNITRDIWFRFVAPASGGVRINSGADFQHVLAVWKGNCNDLSIVYCSDNPLRCDGFITLGGLSAGQSYYLQVASQIAAAGPSSGNVCIKIMDGSVPPDFSPLSFEIQEQCVDVDMAKLKFKLHDGVPPFTFTGNIDGEVLAAGSTYFSIVTDAIGCEQSLTGIVDECQGSACNVAATLDVTQPKCHDSADGAITAMVSGGVGPYFFLWSNGVTSAENTGIAAGTHTVTVTDALDCEQVSSMTLDNPAAIIISASNITNPSVGLSNGSIFVDIIGGTGNYGVNWYRSGFLFAMGVEDLTSVPAGDYQLQVVDANGCMQSFEVTLTETVSNKDVSEAYFTEVFPNPAKDKAVLSVSFPQARTLYLTLSDAAGRALQSWTVENVTEQNIPLDLKGLPGGTYQLRMVTGVEVVVERVVVGR